MFLPLPSASNGQMYNHAHIHRIATAVPEHNVHEAFQTFALGLLTGQRERALFQRMAERSGIDTRYSALRVRPDGPSDGLYAYDFYRQGSFPGTAARMKICEHVAPLLLRSALEKLNLSPEERARIKHVIVTCCTAHYAPGLDFEVIDYLGLDSNVSRTMIGFMGCYAAINGLRQAESIVRGRSEEYVLMVNLELCSLHLQETDDLSEILSFLIFADGCAVSLIGPEPKGLAIDGFRSVVTKGTRDLITWRIGDQGFLMHLSGQVPLAVEELLLRNLSLFEDRGDIAMWAVHPGGRSVLDAVERGLSLPADSLASSRKVLRNYGNMSSATVMFVLEDLMRSAKQGERGVAMSFGPGITAETMTFHAA